MKKHLLLAVVITSFSSLFSAANHKTLLRRAIITVRTAQALLLIEAGVADTQPGDEISEDLLQGMEIRTATKHTHLLLPPLALAAFCQNAAIVKALLARGHSALEEVMCKEIHLHQGRIHDTITSPLEMAKTLNKGAIVQIFKDHDLRTRQQAGDHIQQEDQPLSRKRTYTQAAESVLFLVLEDDHNDERIGE